MLRFVTPEKLRKKILEPELPYPLLRWMTREQKMKLLPSIIPDSDGGYNEADVVELTNEEIKELRLEWNEIFMQENKTAVTVNSYAPAYLQIDPTYCLIIRIRKWEDYHQLLMNHPTWLNYPVFAEPRGAPSLGR